jgi:TRAP-type mannitol/chloroaromatic compound transport system permease small subunit
MTETKPDQGARPSADPGVFDRLVVGMNALGSFWILLLVLLVTSDALGRTFLNQPIAGTHEMIQISVVGIVFLQLADTIRTGRLTRSDSILGIDNLRWPRLAAAMQSSFYLLGAVFMGIGLWGSVPLLKEAIDRGSYIGNDGIFTAPVWPVKTIIVVGLAVCLVQFLRLGLSEFRRAQVKRSGPA